jgi:hypothetical protein
MMKKLLVVLTVLAMATVANAALTAKISVDGVIDAPDTQIVLFPSDTAVIDIHAWNDVSAGQGVLLLQGPGALTLPVWNTTNRWEQSSAAVMSNEEKPDYIAAFTEMGYLNITEIYTMDIVDASEPYTLPNGKVLDGLIFHCEALGDVTLTVFNLDLGVLDSQVIHQIPEPMTLALLGLGGLFLRRRK